MTRTCSVSARAPRARGWAGGQVFLITAQPEGGVTKTGQLQNTNHLLKRPTAAPQHGNIP